MHQREGAKYIFRAKVPGKHVGQSALRRVMATFFQNSAMEAVQTILSDQDFQLDDREIAEIEGLIENAKKRRLQ